MTKHITVAIAGATGYSGMELLKILLRHPRVEIGPLFAHRSAGTDLAEMAPFFRDRLDKKLLLFSPELLLGIDLLFLALPSGEALSLAPLAHAAGVTVIDLGGDFRLQNASLYKEYYKREHTASELLSQATYGLPEWNADAIQNAELVANPGCYPTGALLPLLPLLKEGLIAPNGIVINSLSGVSGAGRTASLETSFAEVNESVRAYKVGVHQHIPEILSVLHKFATKEASISFIPHLIPITRGLFTTTHAFVNAGITETRVMEVFRSAYASAPFVRFGVNTHPEIRNVAHTNYIDIGFHLLPSTGQIVILSAIDNLMKGAAGQAVQNMNLRFRFNETEGLLN